MTMYENSPPTHISFSPLTSSIHPKSYPPHLKPLRPKAHPLHQTQKISSSKSHPIPTYTSSQNLIPSSLHQKYSPPPPKILFYHLANPTTCHQGTPEAHVQLLLANGLMSTAVRKQ